MDDVGFDFEPGLFIEKRFYRPDETARMLSISIDMVYKLIREQKLQAVRIGSVYRIPASAISAISAISTVFSSDS